MTDPVSQITIDDGTTVVNVSGYATLGLLERFSPVSGGSSVTRFLDGTAIKQTSYQKNQIQIRGQGWAPAGLDALDFTVQQTWTIQDAAGTRQYQVFADPPQEEWNINAVSTVWQLTGEET